jgi:hypothetical protein
MTDTYIPRASEGSHWYCPKTKRPVYEVPYADKKKAGQLRPATLRDARQLGLVPGQSSICGIMAAPELTEWIKGQVFDAVMRTEVLVGEPADVYRKRVMVESDNVRDSAAERGTEIHAAIEMHFARKPVSDQFAPWIARVTEVLPSIGDAKWMTEVCVVGPHYGTKIDLLGGSWLIDIKTKDDIEKDKACSLYDKHHMQLAAGGALLDPQPDRYGILFVDRNRPAAKFVEAARADIEKGCEMFRLCARLWQLKNNYTPA